MNISLSLKNLLDPNLHRMRFWRTNEIPDNSERCEFRISPVSGYEVECIKTFFSDSQNGYCETIKSPIQWLYSHSVYEYSLNALCNNNGIADAFVDMLSHIPPRIFVFNVEIEMANDASVTSMINDVANELTGVNYHWLKLDNMIGGGRNALCGTVSIEDCPKAVEFRLKYGV
jgi:hypothetical protein